jgi:hypothetical protein
MKQKNKKFFAITFFFLENYILFFLDISRFEIKILIIAAKLVFFKSFFLYRKLYTTIFFNIKYVLEIRCRNIYIYIKVFEWS